MGITEQQLILYPGLVGIYHSTHQLILSICWLIYGLKLVGLLVYWGPLTGIWMDLSFETEIC